MKKSNSYEVNSGRASGIRIGPAHGILFTVLFLIFILVMGLTETCDTNHFVGFPPEENCETRLEAFWQASPNEVGDTLAGVAGTLAFFWIVLTVLIQSQELSEQRKEIIQNRGLTEEANRINERLLDLERAKLQKSQKAEFNEVVVQKIRRALRVLITLKPYQMTWEIAQDKSRGQPSEAISFCCANLNDDEWPTVVESQKDQLRNLYTKLINAERGNGIAVRPHREDQYEHFKGWLEQAASDSKNATEGFQVSVELIDAIECIALFDLIWNDDRFWHERRTER